MPACPRPTGYRPSGNVPSRLPTCPRIGAAPRKVSYGRRPSPEPTRAHPYQLNAGNRCADRPFPRSCPTVAATVMRSIGALVCVHLSWALPGGAQHPTFADDIPPARPTRCAAGGRPSCWSPMPATTDNYVRRKGSRRRRLCCSASSWPSCCSWPTSSAAPGGPATPSWVARTPLKGYQDIDRHPSAPSPARSCTASTPPCSSPTPATSAAGAHPIPSAGCGHGRADHRCRLPPPSTGGRGPDHLFPPSAPPSTPTSPPSAPRGSTGKRARRPSRPH